MTAILQTKLKRRFFFNENTRISIDISLKLVPKGPINNSPALVQIMAWRRPQATSHYLNQLLLNDWHIYVSLGLNELTYGGLVEPYSVNRYGQHWFC